MIRPNSPDSPAHGFDHFRLHPSLTRGLRAAGFDEPRPIQVETIPACLKGRDVMGLAQTGTGKTAAFALPILQRLIEEPGKGPLVLILAPTRELALQIDAEIRLLATFTSIKTVTIFGGVSAGKQIQALRDRPQIVVGCPGRILDLLNQGRLKLGEVETVVLDEADHMFDMGFLPDVRRILKAVPNDAQHLLFSATMPREIRDLANSVLHKPHVVELAHTAPAERIEHFLCPTGSDRKRDLLDKVLAEPDCKTAIVFTRTKHRAKRLAQQLVKDGLNAVALQGNMSQPQRDRAMSGFRAGTFHILVATDIAARGLDVAGVSYVVNFDPPSTPETYMHRIGRTGRSDMSGIACTFVTNEDVDWMRATERMLGQPIPIRRFAGFENETIGAHGSGEHRRPRGGRPGGSNAPATQPGVGAGRRSRRPSGGASVGSSGGSGGGRRSGPGGGSGGRPGGSGGQRPQQGRSGSRRRG